MDEQTFSRSWRALGAQHDHAIAELRRRWAEPHRRYHDAEHLEECLGWLATVDAEHPHELTLAVYFHDAVYDPTRHDNEAASATLFTQLARAAGLHEDVIARVSTLVLSTANHEAWGGDAALLADLDLAILGAPPARYARFERDVRREYAHYDDETYRRGRTRVLRGFLERLAIYKTPPFQHLEAVARSNLARALARYEGEAEER